MVSEKSKLRRMMIRETYGSHRQSRRRGTEGVRLKFVMGLPKSESGWDEVWTENASTFAD